MALKKMCACGTVIDYGLVRCSECEKKYKKDKRESNRYYDKNVRQNVNVYASKLWHQVRQQALSRDHGLCICCLNNNKIEYATLVHHIDTAEDNKDRVYDINNLISVCRHCHDSVIHTAYNKSDKDKKDMQEKLYKMIDMSM